MNVTWDASQMLEAHTLACNLYPATLTPTDAWNTETTVCIGVWDGSQLVEQGPVLVKFASAGGKPRIGQQAFVASSSDGRGYATAQDIGNRVPFLSYIGGGSGTWQRCRVGRVLNTDRYDLEKLCLVDFRAGNPNDDVPIIQEDGWHSSDIAFPTDADYIWRPGNQVGATMGIDETIVFAMWLESQFQAGTWAVISNTDGVTKGWAFFIQNGDIFFQQYGGGPIGTIDIRNLRFGHNLIALTIVNDGANGQMRCCVNGGLVSGDGYGGEPIQVATITAPIVPPDVATQLRIGGPYGAVPGFRIGGIRACTKLARAATDAELTYWTGAVMADPPRNRLQLDPVLDALFFEQNNCLDGSCEWAWSQARSNVAGGVVVTRVLASAFLWDIAGAPTVRQIFQERLYTSLDWSYRDTPYVIRDARNFPRTLPFARVAFTLSQYQQDIAVAVQGDDWQDADNSHIGVFALVGGVLTILDVLPNASGQPADGKVYWYWANLTALLNETTPASRHIEIWVATHEAYQQTGTPPEGKWSVNGQGLAGLLLYEGTTFDGPAVNKRIVFVGEGELMGHNDFNQAASIITRVRKDYPTAGGPGGVTCEAMTTRGLNEWVSASNGSVSRLARQIALDALEGDPTTAVIYIAWTFLDYDFATWTPTTHATTIAALCAEIRALLTGKIANVHIVVQRSIASFFDAIPNAGAFPGYTMADFDAAVQTLAGNPNIDAIINARVPNVITFLGNNFEPNTAGLGAWKDNIKIALTALGFY